MHGRGAACGAWVGGTGVTALATSSSGVATTVCMQRTINHARATHAHNELPLCYCGENTRNLDRERVVVQVASCLKETIQDEVAQTAVTEGGRGRGVADARHANVRPAVVLWLVQILVDVDGHRPSASAQRPVMMTGLDSSMSCTCNEHRKLAFRSRRSSGIS